MQDNKEAHKELYEYLLHCDHELDDYNFNKRDNELYPQWSEAHDSCSSRDYTDSEDEVICQVNGSKLRKAKFCFCKKHELIDDFKQKYIQKLKQIKASQISELFVWSKELTYVEERLFWTLVFDLEVIEEYKIAGSKVLAQMSKEEESNYKEWKKIIYKKKDFTSLEEYREDLWSFLEILEMQKSENFSTAANLIKDFITDPNLTKKDFHTKRRNLIRISNKLLYILRKYDFAPKTFELIFARCDYYKWREDLGSQYELISGFNKYLEISTNQSELEQMNTTFGTLLSIIEQPDFKEEDLTEYFHLANDEIKFHLLRLKNKLNKEIFGKNVNSDGLKYLSEEDKLSESYYDLVDRYNCDFLERREAVLAYYGEIKNNNAEYDNELVDHAIEALLNKINDSQEKQEALYITRNFLFSLLIKFEDARKEAAGLLYELLDKRTLAKVVDLDIFLLEINRKKVCLVFDDLTDRPIRTGTWNDLDAALEILQIIKEVDIAQKYAPEFKDDILKRFVINTFSGLMTQSKELYLRGVYYASDNAIKYIREFTELSKKNKIKKVKGKMLSLLYSNKTTFEEYQVWKDSLSCIEYFCYKDLSKELKEDNLVKALPRYKACALNISDNIKQLEDSLGALDRVKAKILSDGVDFQVQKELIRKINNKELKTVPKDQNSFIEQLNLIVTKHKRIHDLLHFKATTLMKITNRQYHFDSIFSLLEDGNLKIVNSENLLFSYQGFEFYLLIGNFDQNDGYTLYDFDTLTKIYELISLYQYRKEIKESIIDEETLYEEYKAKLNDTSNQYLVWLYDLSDKKFELLKDFKPRYMAEIMENIEDYMTKALHKKSISYDEYIEWCNNLNDAEYACYKKNRKKLNEEKNLPDLKACQPEQEFHGCETLKDIEFDYESHYSSNFNIKRNKEFAELYQKYCEEYYDKEPIENTWIRKEFKISLNQECNDKKRIESYFNHEYSCSIKFPNVGLLDDLAKAFALMTVKDGLEFSNIDILEFQYREQVFFLCFRDCAAIERSPVRADEHRAMLKKISADKHRDYLAKQVNLVAGEIELDDAHEADWHKRQRQILISDEEKRKKNQAAMYNYMILRYDLAKQINLLPAIESFIKSCKSQADDPNILNRIISWEKSLSFVESQVYYKLLQQPAIEGSPFDKTTQRWQKFDANSASDSQSTIEDIYNKLCLVLDCNISNSPSVLNKEEFNENLWSKNYNIIPLQVIKYKDLADRLDAKIMQWNQQGELDLVNVLFDYMLEDDDLDIQESDREDFIKANFSGYISKMRELYSDYLDIKKVPCEKFSSLRTAEWQSILKKVLINYLDPSKSIDEEELLRTIDFLSRFYYLGDDLSQSARESHSGEYFIVNNELMLFKLFLDYDIQDLLQIRNKSWKLIEKVPNSLLEEVRSLSKAEFDDFYKTVHHNDKYDIADYLPKEISSIKRFLNFRKVYMTFRQLIVKAEHNKMLRKLDQYTADYEYEPIQGGYCDIESLYRVFNYDKDFKQKTLELELNIVNQIRAKYNLGEISKAEYELIDHFVHDLCFDKSIKDSFETYSHSALYKNELLEHCLDCVEYILGDQDDKALPEHLSRLVQIVVNEYWKC